MGDKIEDKIDTTHPTLDSVQHRKVISCLKILLILCMYCQLIIDQLMHYVALHFHGCLNSIYGPL